VTLELFDGSGRIVGTPVHGYAPAGGHRVTVNSASFLPEKVVFCRLTEGSAAITAKVLILR
jgi:hypothetical protein